MLGDTVGLSLLGDLCCCRPDPDALRVSRCLAQGVGPAPEYTSSLSLPQVCGSLGAGLPQLLPLPVHTVYLAGWLPPHPAEVTGTSEEPLWLPRFGIAVSLAGDRQRKGAAAGPRRLRGGREWQCSLVGAGGTRRGLPERAAAWGPPGKGHLQRTVVPTTQKGETVWLGTGKKTPPKR